MSNLELLYELERKKLLIKDSGFNDYIERFHLIDCDYHFIYCHTTHPNIALGDKVLIYSNDLGDFYILSRAVRLDIFIEQIQSSEIKAFCLFNLDIFY